MQKSELRVALIIVASTFLLGACNVMKVLQPSDDKAITTAIQAKLFEDSVLKTRDIHVASQKGVVTLTGTVGTDLEKAAAERLAGQASGVKSVVNQLEVSGSPAVSNPAPEAPTQTAEATPPPVQPSPASQNAPAKKPRHHERASTRRSAVAATEKPAETVATAPPAAAPEAAPAAAQAAAPAAPSPPPPPPPEQIAIPTGTVVTIRMIDGVDSTRNRPGEEFAASLAAPVVVGDRVVIPQGADARVRLIQSRSAGRMTGRSELQIELVSLTAGNNAYEVQSSVVEKQGASRGTRTAETVGGGAGLGALIGAIAGRGKGAAIGAAIGAGAGTATQAATHGEQVKVAPETKLDFVLKAPVTVTMEPRS